METCDMNECADMTAHRSLACRPPVIVTEAPVQQEDETSTEQESWFDKFKSLIGVAAGAITGIAAVVAVPWGILKFCMGKGDDNEEYHAQKIPAPQIEPEEFKHEITAKQLGLPVATRDFRQEAKEKAAQASAAARQAATATPAATAPVVAAPNAASAAPS
jgi:hypothetical protein